jgi:hypothetical protein
MAAEVFEGIWAAGFEEEVEVLELAVFDGQAWMLSQCGAGYCESQAPVAFLRQKGARSDSLLAFTAKFTTDSTETVVLATLVDEFTLRVQTVTLFTDPAAEGGRWSEETLHLTRAVETAGPPEEIESFLPVFPLPAPRWTLRYPIPDSLGTRGNEPLGVVYDRLENALREAGVVDFGVYGILHASSDSVEGFAIVSRQERIEEDGRPADPRWGERAPVEMRSLVDYLRQLFDPGPGRYRVLVLITTARPIRPTSETPTAERMEQMRRQGEDTIPDALRSRMLDLSARVTALIYEFYRPSEDDEVRILGESQSRLTAVDHLVGAGLWKEALRRR